MKISIITINYNNATGLKKTAQSVAEQLPCNLEVEHIIVDGNSTDESVAIIKDYARDIEEKSLHLALKWVSEPDNGIYNAMNKGIRMASGDYIQILNSGDILAAADVLSRMYDSFIALFPMPEIIYGNMLKTKDGVHIYRDTAGRSVGTPDSFLYFYRGTMNHDTAWIKRDLFERFGLYNEEMKICSDWKWYVDAVAIGGVKPIYVDIDVTIFDMNGISESEGKNRAIIQTERREYLEKILPASVLNDYDTYAFPIVQYRRLKRYHLWGVVYFVERVLFKLKKWGFLR